MERIQRYAVYYAPRGGSFAEHTLRWLSGSVDLPGLPRPATEITVEPRRYGFHGTLRAPFRLADDVSETAVRDTVAGLAARLAPVHCDGLRLVNLHRFLALVPLGNEAALPELAAAVVAGTDALRAPLSEAEIARRRPEHLSPRQRSLLDIWGYPFVMEEFRFHLTLTDRLPDAEATVVAGLLQGYLAPVMPAPFLIEDLCLFGEDAGGTFHLLHRYALAI